MSLSHSSHPMLARQWVFEPSACKDLKIQKLPAKEAATGPSCGS